MINEFFTLRNQRRCCNELVIKPEDECIEEDEHDVSSHFFQTQENQPFDLQQQLEK